MNSSNPIGVFDSGIGGLTVASAINKLLPNERLIYFGDTQHLPYGNKSVQEIDYYSQVITNFLINKKCKAIVIACNSAASSFSGLEHNCLFFNVIDPVIQYIKKTETIKHVGVIGTKATIKSNIYQKKINSVRTNVKVSSLATPRLASLIEEDDERLYENQILNSYLEDEKLKKIDSIILGCTHYPLIEKKIQDFYKSRVRIISSIEHIASYIKEKLIREKLLNQNPLRLKHNFYVSKYSRGFQQKTKLFFPKSIILQEENIFS